MIKQTLKVSEVKNNPNNPRLIKDDKFTKLVQSIKDFPEMLEAREIVVNKDHIILGGNMRFKAAKEAGLKEVPVKVVDWPEDKQREFVIKDNVSGGEWDWDLIANEWDAEELDKWGIDIPSDWGDNENVSEAEDNNEELKTIVVVAYSNINDLDKITDFYHLTSIDITDNIKEDLSGVRKVYVFKS